MASEHGYMYGRANAEHLRVVVRDGRPVSHFGFMVWDISLLGVPLRMASVGGVGTLADYRGAGYATQLLGDAERVMRREAVDLVLVSGGRGLYTRNGYVPVGRCLAFNAGCPPPRDGRVSGMAVRTFRPRDLAAFARLSAGEPVRYQRSREQLQQLMAGRLARKVPDRYYMVSITGQDVAWFNISTTLDGRKRLLWEYAGDRGAVLDGVGAAMRRRRWTKLSATVPADDPLVAHLKAAGFVAAQEALPEHTLKILDFRTFMGKLGLVWGERAGVECSGALRFGRSGTGGTIRDGESILRLPDSCAVAALLFGGDTPARSAARRAGGRIGEFVQEALPLPFMLPGMNYV